MMRHLSTAILLLLIVVSAHADTTEPRFIAADLFDYLVANHKDTTGLDISTDADAQDKWLSTALKESLRRQNTFIQRRKPKIKDTDRPLEPFDNSSFLLAWDRPSKFVIRSISTTPYNAIVTGEAVWGKDRQYAGERRPTFFVFVNENGKWLVDDIQAGKAAYNPDMSLRRNLDARVKKE